MSSMLQATEKIWMNGSFVKWDEAKVHILTHSLHYGTGVFEGIRCYKTDAGPAVFRLQEHVDRLFDSSHILQMPIPFTREVVAEAILETIRVNKLTLTKSARERRLPKLCSWPRSGFGERRLFRWSGGASLGLWQS